MDKILKLEPAYKDYVWGGERLKKEYNKNSPYEKTAESWELSCHKNGLTKISGGKFDGKTLAEVIESAKADGIDVLGTRCAAFSDFPVLIKLIDADAALSIQVHPDNEYANANENGGFGKTEVWYVVAAEEGAELIYGWRRDVTKEELRGAIEKSELAPLLNSVPVKAGDVFFVPAGLLHAIGKGILLAEVQQSCNTTYRVFDYNRTGLDGKPRELHVSKAVDVTECTVPKGTLAPEGMPVKHDGYTSILLSECPYFTMTSIDVDALYSDNADDTSFVSLVVLDGEGTIRCGDDERAFKKGDSIFIPASSGCYYVSGKAKILHTKV